MRQNAALCGNGLTFLIQECKSEWFVNTVNPWPGFHRGRSNRTTKTDEECE